MKKYVYTIIWLVFGVHYALAQFHVNENELLDEVIVTNKLLSDFSTGQKRLQLKDSVLQQNPSNLSDLLSFNTSIHFNQNGYGMVSSPSFRGTTAQQTAVVWNGININSQLNGQGDFNALLNPTMQQIVIKPGGGSVIFGTSAIGGSIHLESKMKFNSASKHIFQNNFGSFNTLDTQYQWQQSSNQWSFNFGIQRNTSDNDFPIANTDQNNINGKFNTNSLGFDSAYRLDDKNQFKLYSWWLVSNRNLSVIRPSDTKSAFSNQDVRLLLEWEYKNERLRSTTKLGFLNENFEFTQNIDRPNETTGNAADTYLLRYHVQYEHNNWVLSSLIDANTAAASGDDLGENNRNAFALALLAKYKLNKKWIIEASFRQEASNWYNSPILYSLGSDYRFSDLYSMKLHTSKNFRIPTFNDLFWGDTGEISLLPEIAYQVEWGHHFAWKSVHFSATGFYNHIDDMIRWIPNENLIWRPENTDKVRTYGAELDADFAKKWDQNTFNFKLNYAYTVSENRETGFQLRYVPFHKTTSSVAFTHKKWTADTHFVYVGKMFTRSNNAVNATLDAYALHHLGLRYHLAIKEVPINIGVRVFNLWNATFQGIENRPMPGRYFQFQFSITI